MTAKRLSASRRSMTLLVIFALLVLGIVPGGQRLTPRPATGSTAVEAPEHPEGASFNPNQIKDIKAGDPGAGINLVNAPSASNLGDARLVYPLQVPPGRAGVAPQLGLQYSSSAGNGWLGTGWDVSVPKIAIDTRWGVPRYHAGLETETYVFNGEQLTPVAHRSELVARTAEKVFHTRVEGQFSRIVRHGDNPANYWWEVTDKAGTRMVFGTAADTRLADANGNIATWALREVRDAHDNLMRYHHVTVEDGGVAGASVPGRDLYLEKITYTGRGDTEGRYSVTFDRDRERGEPRRADVGIDARLGFKRVTADLLRRVEVRLDDQLIRAYELNYRTGAFHKSLLQSVSQFGEDNRLFHTHTFDYFDDIRDQAGAYDAFTGATGWSMPDDGLGANVRDGEAGALSSNTSKSAGGHLYVGYNPTSPSKSNSAGLKVGYNAGSSEGLLALADVNGDNLPDKVFRNGGGIFYRPNLSGPTGQARFGDTPIRLSNLPGIGKEKNRSTTVGIESYFGVAAQLDYVSTTTTADRYFADVNGDGITDLVNNGGVLFGHLDANGNPAYSANSHDTPVPVGAGTTSGAIVGDQTAEFERQVDAAPLLDGVRRWIAPYDGTVQIDGRVRLVEDTSPDRAEYRAADGVRVAIQHKDTELWSQRIGPQDHIEFEPTGVNAIQVQRGDAIYFRVQSILDGNYDQVAWDPDISYVGMVASTDVNGLDNNRYLASRDFTLGGRPSVVTAPLTGTLHLSGDAVKSGPTTDDVAVVVSRNGTDVLTRTLSAAAGGTAAIDLDIPVTVNDKLSWRLKADSPIDAATLTWVPRAHYTGADGVDSVVDANGDPAIVISAPYDLDLYPATTLTAPQGHFTAPATGQLTVQPALGFDFAGQTPDTKVVFTVKKRGALLAKRVIDIVDGQVPALAALSVPVTEGDDLFFDYSSLDTSLLAKLTGQSVTVSTDGTTFAAAPSALHTSAEQGAFAQPYRGWAAIGYQGNRARATSPIAQSELVIDENYRDQLPDGPTEADLPGFTADPKVTAPKIVVFAPMPALGRWAGADENTWVAAAGASSSRLGLDVIDVMRDADFAGATAVPRRGKTKQISTTLGVGPLGGSLAKGRSTGEVDFLDLNGDRFPDVVGSAGVQYSDMTGGLGGTRGSVGGNVRESESLAYSVSGNAGSPARTSSSGRGQDVPTGGTNANTAKSGVEMPALGIGGNLGGGDSDTAFDLIDINGDALPDRVFENGDAALNLGYSFAGREPWPGGPVNTGDTRNAGVNLGFNTDYYGFAGGVSAALGSGKTDATLMDMNGDGLMDRVFAHDGQPVGVAINTGTGFAAPTPFRGSHAGVNTDKNASLGGGVYVTFGFCFIFGCIVFNPGADVSTGIGRTELALRDVNGDGYVDHVRSTKDDELIVAENKTGRTNLLKSVGRPMGARIDLDYARSGNTYDSPESRWVLTRTAVNDGHPGDGDDVQLSTFRYENGKHDRLEREFLGYGKVVTEQRDAAAAVYRTKTDEYRVDSYYTRGLLARTATADAAGKLFAESLNTYQLRDVSTGAAAAPDSTTATVFPQLAKTERRFYEGQATPGKTTSTEMSYDEYGNLIRSFDAADAGAADDLETRLGYSATIPACRDRNIVGVANSVTETGGTVLRNRQSIVDCATADVRQVKEFLADGAAAVTDMEYFPDGNLKSVTEPANKNGERYRTDYGYDAVVGVHIESIVDSFGYRSTSTHNLKYGLPDSVTDKNNQQLRTAYDSVGRTDSITGPYELPENRFTIDFEYHPEAAVPYAVTRHVDRTATGVRADTIDTVQFADGLKRLLQTKKDATVAPAPGADPQPVMTVSGRAKYDFVGRTVEQYYPVTEPKGDNNSTFNGTFDTVPPTKTDFDVLDRVRKTVIPDGTTSLQAYGFGADRSGATRFETIATDGNGKQRRTYQDVRTLTTAVKEFNPAGGQPVIWTSYGFDALGQLTAVVDDKNNTTSSVYDNFGRRTVIDSPDSGRAETRYDLAGNMTAKITSKLRAANKVVEYDYRFTRLAGVRYPTFSGNNVTYTYGAPGAPNNAADRITHVRDGAGEVARAYGPLGELTRETRTVPESILNGPARSYSTGYTYDSFNRVLKLNYPDGELLTYEYDSGGQVNRATGVKGEFDYTYLARMDYDKFAQRVLMETGTGVRTTYAYDAADRQLATLKARLPDGHEFQNISYTYDNIGNIKQLHNAVALPHGKPIGGPSTQTYGYDDLYRVTSAHGEYRNKDNKLDRYDLSLRYDSIHNTVSKTQRHEIVVNSMETEFATVAYQPTQPTQQSSEPVADPVAPVTVEEETAANPPLGVIEEPDEDAPLTVEEQQSLTTTQQGGTTAQPQRQTSYDYNYAYTGAKPHAPSKIGPVNQTYDANGNLVDTVNTLPPAPGKRRQMVWDEENRLACNQDHNRNSTIAQDPSVCTSPQQPSTVRYYYDDDGTRVVKIAGPQHLYPNQNFSERNGTGFKHVFVGDVRLATKTVKPDTSFENHIFYFHADHLGSSGYVTDEFANLTEHNEYFAFGETWVNEHPAQPTPVPFQYGSKELDEETGLYYYGARYYNPRTNLWQSPDPILGDYLDGSPNRGVYQPFNLALYTYGNANPVRMTDPDGRSTWNRVMGAVKLVGGTLEAAGGVTLATTTGVTGVGAVAGALVAVHGADTAVTGWKQLWTGEDESSGTSKLIQAAGVSKQTADMIDGGIGLVGGGGAAIATSRMATATRTAATVGSHAMPALPKALQGGANSTHVYFGTDAGKVVYAGITNSIARRQGEHGARFAIEAITKNPLTRGQARAVEEALIVRYGGTVREGGALQNIKHSISPTHAYYKDAVAWGNAWLKANGL
ncbi:RHS repeat-associated core domain-containing protein [Actinokineospora alba]|uniref:RHS repeat-associated core domain-containing protein n=1 Tax=Actinokineospora alba TaxID=504798 RepID=A0A1H0EXC8_9PSEU|nr:SpvB/TcaC N-terminal domain-containing protein [Actinokineospora alba]TDP69260.1 RHS repeat-associated protein [Actinokineospora alba]SDI20785.1 RHS repeat-associated core domain-containing protein [Actinokineospora alba]SDN87003.1 RHS repeat-associated core domain-containing protein [Actinokineospora alba]